MMLICHNATVDSFIIFISHTWLVKKTQYVLPRNSYKLFFTDKKNVAFKRKRTSIINKHLGGEKSLSFFMSLLRILMKTCKIIICITSQLEGQRLWHVISGQNER